MGNLIAHGASWPTYRFHKQSKALQSIGFPSAAWEPEEKLDRDVGPIIILDKSAFQSLSRRELIMLRRYFYQNLTPILAIEILGDLTKHVKNCRISPESKVAELSRKFGGSGPVVNAHYRSLCIRNLLGAEVSMEHGQIVVDHGDHVKAPDGTKGFIIDLHPLNEAIMRWSEGHFSEAERIVSLSWRSITRSFSFSSFRKELDRCFVIIPRASSIDEIGSIVDDLLITSGLQDVWFNWLVSQLTLPSEFERKLKRKWAFRRSFLFRDHAPYANHCVRVQLSLHVAVRSMLIRWDPTNLLDLQYLYYLPFCMAFASNDKLHITLAPILLRKNQSFVIGRDLKDSLRKIADHLESLSDLERKKLKFALGSYPFPDQNSVVSKLWSKHLSPWSRRSGDKMTSIPEGDKIQVIREVEEMFIKCGFPVENYGPSEKLKPTQNRDNL